VCLVTGFLEPVWREDDREIENMCMVVTKQATVPECNIFVEGIKIQQDKFNYLGSLLTSDGKCDTEIKRRIGTAKDLFKKMDNILLNRNISMTTKLRVLECYIMPVLTYASETWTISTAIEKRLQPKSGF